MGLLGFTFGFGARDQGLRSSFGAASNSLKEIGEQVSHLGSVAKNVTLGTMFSGFNMAAVSRISEGMDKITGGNINLVNSLESTMAASRKSAKVIGAQQGLVGRDLAKFASSAASTAYSMNLGIDQVAKGQKSFQGLNAAFRKGLEGTGKSLKSFLKAEEATGISSEDLLRVLDGLGGSFKFTGEEAGGFLDKFTATALAGGQGSVAFGTLKENVDNLRTSLQANSAFLALDADAQKKYVEDQILGVQRLAGSLSKTFEMIPAEAQAAAAGFAQKLNEQQTAIQKMVVGVGDDYGDLFNTISKETGLDAATVFVGKSPEDAMKALVKIREHLIGMGDKGQSGLQRINLAFQELAPNLQVGLLDAEKSEKMVSNLDSITKAADGSAGAFTKFGNAAYSSGLTVADSVERAKAAFETTLGAIGGGTGAFASEQVKGYEGAADAVRKLASDDTWGPLTKRFAIASRIGVSGFLLPMREEGEALTTQIKKVSDATGKGGLIGRLQAIQQLGLAGVFLDFNKATTDTAGAMDLAQNKAQEVYERFTILKTLKDAFIPVVIALAGALGAVVGALKLFSVAKDALTSILSPIASVTKALFQLTLSAMGFAAAIIGWPATLFIAIVAFIAIWQSLPQKVKDAIDKMLGTAAGFIDKLTVSLMAFDGEAFANKILDVLDGVAMSIKAFFSGEELSAGLNDSGAKKFGIALGNFMTTAWETLKETVGTLLKGMWEDPEIKKYITIPLGVALAAGAVPKVASMLSDVADTDVGKKGVGYSKKGFGKVGGALKNVVTGGRKGSAAGGAALEALNFAKGEAGIAQELLAEAAAMTASAYTASAVAAAKASTVAATAIAAETTAAVAAAEGAFAATSWYATGMAAGTGILQGIGTALGATGAAATAVGGSVVLIAAAAVTAGVTAAYASPETKKVATDWMNGLNESISSWSANLKKMASGAGESFADGISSVMGFMNLDWLDGEAFNQKVNDSFLWLMNLGNTFVESMMNIDLTGAAVRFVGGMFNSESFASATEAVDWGALATDIMYAIWGGIKSIGSGLVFVTQILGGIIYAIGDGILALVTVVVGGLGTLLLGVLKKALLSVATLFGEFLKMRLGEIRWLASMLPDSVGGGIVKGIDGMNAKIDGAIASVTPTSQELAARAAKQAAAAAAKVQDASAAALLEQQQKNAGQFSKYYEEGVAPMLSKMGVNVDELSGEQLSMFHSRLNAATEEYAKSGKDFSERAAQRLLAASAKGFATELETAGGIMAGMTVDSTLTQAEVAAGTERITKEFDAGIRAALESQNISFDVLTDAKRKELKDQGIQFTELTDAQRQFFTDKMTETAQKMAASGKEFSDKNKETLMKSILDGFATQGALDKLEEQRKKYGMLFQEPKQQFGMLYDPTQQAPTTFAPSFGGVGDAVSKLTGGAFDAGKSALEATAGGLQAGAPLVADAMGTALGQIVDYLPKKGKPKTGKGTVVNVADGGVQVMAEIARGMIEGTTMMVLAMEDAMTKVNESMISGMDLLFSNMSSAFEVVGRYASDAFTKGVLTEQDLQMEYIRERLNTLFGSEFAGSLEVVDTSGSATISVDTVGTLTKQIVLLRQEMGAKLDAIQSNTFNTAENTKKGSNVTFQLGGGGETKARKSNNQSQ
jgi:hypothetical protein